MQLLSSFSRVLTSYTYQDGYSECGGSQLYHYGMFAVHKIPLSYLFIESRLRRVQKKSKREQKMKNRVLQKTLFYFSVFMSWKWLSGLVRVEKMVWDRCARRKIFLTFCRQLGCAILEISSGTV